MAEFFAEPRSWVAIAFVVFFVLFGGKLWGVIRDILDKRAETVRAELAEAQRLRNEAEALLRDARARRETALAEAKRLSEAAAADAEASAARRERMALDRIAAAEKAAVDEVRLAAADIAAK